ncbi:MAG: UDP-2,4-diacetamido-2,4,6-trideoxy-beta-L-altropyranose hydrolase [Chlorobium sp.]
MNVAFRVDASCQIGTGHFMRCFTLANALKQRGANIRFISLKLSENFRTMLSDKEYDFIQLNAATTGSIIDELAHSHWLGICQNSDAQATINALSGLIWDWLVVDHYALDARWESALRQAAKRIFVIDDIADRQHDCDVLLDQNYYTDMDKRYVGKIPAHCLLLLGPRYALLRKEFFLLRQEVQPRIGPVKRILVFFGGVDAENYTSKTIDALASKRLNIIHVDVVIGKQHPFREEIEASCAEHRFACHVQTSRISELMASADLGIGAGGSATWERCCMGLPTLVIATSDNQIKQVGDAASEGLLYAPSINEDFYGLIQRHLSTLIENSNLRNFISNQALSAVDGRGVLRVIRKMGSIEIKMRVATPNDSERLFKWRNHTKIRAVSRNSDEIDWSDHQKWYRAVLSSSERALLIGSLHGVDIGVVRFDIIDDMAEVSIYVVPDINMSGIGNDLLQSAEDWLKNVRPEISVIQAVVLGGNTRSHKFFSGLNYNVESICYLKKIYA